MLAENNDGSEVKPGRDFFPLEFLLLYVYQLFLATKQTRLLHPPVFYVDLFVFFFQPIKDTVLHLEPVYEQLLRAGGNVLETSEPGPDKDALEQRLQNTKDRWNEVKRKTADRQEQLEQVVPLAKKYRDETQSLKPWLSDAEKTLQEIKPDSCDVAVLDKQLKALRGLKADVDDHKPDFDELNETSPALVESCKADKFVIDGGTQDLTKRYENLANDTSALEKKLEDVKDAAEQFNNAVKPVDELFDEVDKLLESHEPTGINVAKGKDELSKVVDLLKALKENEPEVNEVNNAGQKLLSEVGEKSPAATHVKQEMQAVNQRYQDLLDALTNRKANLENDLVQANKFHDALHDLEERLPEVQEAVSAQEPISSDPEVVKQQLQQAEVVIKPLNKCVKPSFCNLHFTYVWYHLFRIN